jgi:phosphoglycolate phosphatase
MSHPLPTLIFDLDGTLTDSKPGILACLRKVIDARNLGDQGPLDRFVGPPVEEWTVELLPAGSDEDRAALARDYRACYDREGWSNNSVFPGVREMLTDLHRQGFPLYVCTSKQQRFAMRILDFFELAGQFTAIYGDKVEYASHSKADLLALLIREHSLDQASAWMIGDRIYDIQAAHANHIRCLAAGWGYGSAEECAAADAVATTPADVSELVLPHHLKAKPDCKAPILTAKQYR